MLPYRRGVVEAKRTDLGKAAPAAYKAMGVLAREVKFFTERAGLERPLFELVKIRVSQINGCAYCLDMHHRGALAEGEDPRRLAVLPAWRETTWFSARERAALRLAESVTLVADGQVPDSVYTAAGEVLGEDEIAAVSWLAITMNAFNRIAITSRYPVGPPS